MKNILIVLIIVLSIKGLAQNSQDCLDSLYSQDYLIKLFAVECVTELKIQEAFNVLETLLLNQPPYLQMQFINALYALNDPNIIQKAHALISRADTFDQDAEYPFDPLDAKVFATAILVYKGDFSTTNYVFEKLNRNEVTIKDITSIHLLPYIIRNIPAHKDEAKSILTNQLNNADATIRYYSLLYLAEEFGEEVNQELINKFVNDSDLPVKVKALEYLCINRYADLESLLKEQLAFEEESTLRTDISDTLLQKFGNPSDLKAVIDHQPLEPNETARSLLGSAIREFVPPRPSTSTSVSDMVSNLISTTDTLFNYTWLGDLTFTNSLKSKLTQAKIYLLSGDSLTCAIQVKSFQDDVNLVYKDSLNPDPRFVTIEGWKFLYYNAQYILDRLPEVILVPIIGSINPGMSLVNPGAFTLEVKGSKFTSASVVYFKGQAKATTFVSDTVLTAQILASDVSTAGNFQVYVSTKGKNSVTLNFSVVSKLPKSLAPIVNCVSNNGNGTYTAYFGYNNQNTASVYMPIGTLNKFNPTPIDRGQPKVFQAGIKNQVVSITWDGSNLSWVINGKTVTASKKSAKCP